MKKSSTITSIFLAVLLLSSCESTYQFDLKVSKKTTLNKILDVSLTEKNEKIIDKIEFFIDGKKVASEGNAIKINTATIGVGKHMVTALIFYPKRTKKINKTIEVLSDKPFKVYDFKIINTYPHDSGAFTQGLEYHNGFLYETTGQRGKSSLRKVDLKSGKVVQKVDLDKRFFGEGMTIINDKIVWLTWKGKKGFVYNLNTFEQEGEFAFNKSKEGWGLTHNENSLIKSDGSHKIWFLDPESKKEQHFIQVYNHKQGLPFLNELEYFNGKIYANYWKKPLIAIINPKTGIVEGIANLTRLKEKMEKEYRIKGSDQVLNGIAYDKKNNRIFVTGKNWSKLFEIELFKKQ